MATVASPFRKMHSHFSYNVTGFWGLTLSKDSPLQQQRTSRLNIMRPVSYLAKKQNTYRDGPMET